jgi:hypothetical protein
MPSIFYDIFNKNIKINEVVLKQLRVELEALLGRFKEKNDIDYIRVLRNKLHHLLETKQKKVDKKTKSELEKLECFLEEINEYIKKEEKEQVEMIDVVQKVDEKYKIDIEIPEEKKKKYKKTYRKKSTIKYEKELIKLQVELLKLQKCVKENGKKLLIIFE